MTTYAVREVEQEVEEVQAAIAERPQCAHHWVIEPANGPVSPGQCQKCWEVRDFKNFVDSYHQDDE